MALSQCLRIGSLLCIFLKCFSNYCGHEFPAFGEEFLVVHFPPVFGHSMESASLVIGVLFVSRSIVGRIFVADFAVDRPFHQSLVGDLVVVALIGHSIGLEPGFRV